MKYQPDYPDRFGSLADARQWSHGFFTWYNQEHHHTALNLLTPADVHYGRADEILARRQDVLDRAYAAHPQRFIKGPPKIAQLPAAVWINRPSEAGSPEAPLVEPVC